VRSRGQVAGSKSPPVTNPNVAGNTFKKNMRLLTGLLIFLTLTTYGQTTKRSDWKVIPNNLDESLTRLNFLLGDRFKGDFKTLEEKEAVERINFIGLGTQLRNDWKLWKGSKLSEYFNGIGVNG
jgi:hypothetical protein